MDIEKFKGLEAWYHEMLVPGRPIISQCTSPTMLIGHLIVGQFFVPQVQTKHTYFRDSIDFESMH